MSPTLNNQDIRISQTQLNDKLNKMGENMSQFMSLLNQIQQNTQDNNHPFSSLSQ